MNFAELNYLSYTLLETLAGTAVRSVCFAALCATALWFLRVRKPEFKHFLWSGLLYALLLLPLFQLATPPLRHAAPLLPGPHINFLAPPSNPSPLRAAVAASTVTHPAVSGNTPRPFPWMPSAVALYLIVAGILLARLAFSLWRIQRIVLRSEPILDPCLRGLCHEVWLGSLSMVKPRVRLSRGVTIPLAVGSEEPVILLPVFWQHWSQEKLHAVLVHEMAHVRRGDPGTALLSSIAVCLFWFHPLAYWLRRQLATSAEESCDEAVLEFVKPERYSQILIEFASAVSSTRGRLLAVSSVAAHRSQIVKRIERIFAPRPANRISMKLAQALAVVVLCPALYLTAAARFEDNQPTAAQETTTQLNIGSDTDAQKLEAELQSNPEDLKTRNEVMSYYFNERNEPALAKHLLWAVEHHPELRMSTMGQSSLDRQELRVAWDNALVKHPDSAPVLYHAGMFFTHDNPMRALALYKQAQSLVAPDSYTAKNVSRATAVVYAAAVMEEVPNSHGAPTRLDNINIDPTDAAQLRADLAVSQDPALLSEVGTVLTQLSFSAKGLPLIQQAIALDPAIQPGRTHWNQPKLSPSGSRTPKSWGRQPRRTWQTTPPAPSSASVQRSKPPT